MHRQLPYEPILPQAKDWPVVKMHQGLPDFLQEVSKKAVEDIWALHPDHTALRQELSRSLASEQERLQKKPWKVDSPEDYEFWSQILADLGQEQLSLPTILQKIVSRFAGEIAGGFSLWHYRLAQGTASYTLNRLLNPMKPRRLRTFTQIQAKLQEQIQLLGAVKEVRELSKQGTIVMVPTHCSHFDSVLIWWVIDLLGLPPFIYGAGRNLFNRQFFAYFMNKLGTYKVDRRRRNVAYLTTLKAYSTMALHWGCHSLFYPGGTRSRSGALESSLKLGLLGTAIEAQRMNYRKQGPTAPKIFIVPVTFSYHFVLEAPLLIRDYLAEQGEQGDQSQETDYTRIYKLFKFIKNIATKSSSIAVSIGQPLDVLGNPVDAGGHSYTEKGEEIIIYQELCGGDGQQESGQKIKEYTRKLGQAVVQSYYQNNDVLSSHLLAFVAFSLLRQQHADLSNQAFFQLPVEQLIIPYPDLEYTFAKIRKVILAWQASGQIRVADHLQEGSIAGMIIHGLTNLGVYHIRKPLLRNRVGDVTTQDLPTLFYYHNRLTGYGFEKYLE
jgi:glycerol-3-phosphate O-acyltransferase